MYEVCVGVHCVAVAVCSVGTLYHLRLCGVRYVVSSCCMLSCAFSCGIMAYIPDQ